MAFAMGSCPCSRPPKSSTKRPHHATSPLADMFDAVQRDACCTRRIASSSSRSFVSLAWGLQFLSPIVAELISAESAGGRPAQNASAVPSEVAQVAVANSRTHRSQSRSISMTSKPWMPRCCMPRKCRRPGTSPPARSARGPLRRGTACEPGHPAAARVPAHRAPRTATLRNERVAGAPRDSPFAA